MKSARSLEKKKKEIEKHPYLFTILHRPKRCVWNILNMEVLHVLKELEKHPKYFFTISQRPKRCDFGILKEIEKHPKYFFSISKRPKR